jgi:hypothetical protein
MIPGLTVSISDSLFRAASLTVVDDGVDDASEDGAEVSVSGAELVGSADVCGSEDASEEVGGSVDVSGGGGADVDSGAAGVVEAPSMGTPVSLESQHKIAKSIKERKRTCAKAGRKVRCDLVLGNATSRDSTIPNTELEIVGRTQTLPVGGIGASIRLEDVSSIINTFVLSKCVNTKPRVQ